MKNKNIIFERFQVLEKIRTSIFSIDSSSDNENSLKVFNYQAVLYPLVLVNKDGIQTEDLQRVMTFIYEKDPRTGKTLIQSFLNLSMKAAFKGHQFWIEYYYQKLIYVILSWSLIVYRKLFISTSTIERMILRSNSYISWIILCKYYFHCIQQSALRLI